MTNEIWKPISTKLYPYYESLVNQVYEVSNYGRIRNSKTGKIINPFVTQNRYIWTMHYNTCGWNYTLQFLVSHTVYETFVGDCFDKVVYHRDGNKFNNNVDNLFIK